MDAEETMVYKALDSRLPVYNGVRVWISHNYDPAYWEPIFAKAQADINSVREWALTLPHGTIRDHYLSWLEHYYQHGLDDARKEVRDQIQKREMEEYRKENERTQKDIAEYCGEIPKPPR